MICAFCKKTLPADPQQTCPNCFAAWTPDLESEVKTDNEVKGEK